MGNDFSKKVRPLTEYNNNKKASLANIFAIQDESLESAYSQRLGFYKNVEKGYDDLLQILGIVGMSTNKNKKVEELREKLSKQLEDYRSGGKDINALRRRLQVALKGTVYKDLAEQIKPNAQAGGGDDIDNPLQNIYKKIKALEEELETATIESNSSNINIRTRAKAKEQRIKMDIGAQKDRLRAHKKLERHDTGNRVGASSQTRQLQPGKQSVLSLEKPRVGEPVPPQERPLQPGKQSVLSLEKPRVGESGSPKQSEEILTGESSQDQYRKIEYVPSPDAGASDSLPDTDAYVSPPPSQTVAIVTPPPSQRGASDPPPVPATQSVPVPSTPQRRTRTEVINKEEASPSPQQAQPPSAFRKRPRTDTDEHVPSIKEVSFGKVDRSDPSVKDSVDGIVKQLKEKARNPSKKTDDFNDMIEALPESDKKKLADIIYNDPLLTPENGKVTLVDRATFIALTYIIRVIALFITEWGLFSGYISTFASAFNLYFAMYICILLLMVFITNSNKNNVVFKLLLYYINLSSIDGKGKLRIIVHILCILTILPIPYIVKDYNIADKNSSVLTYTERATILSSIDKFSLYVWIFTSIIAFKL